MHNPLSSVKPGFEILFIDRPTDQIVIALRDRKFPVEYLVASDEGHGFARPVNNMAAFAATEKFLARHLADDSRSR